MALPSALSGRLRLPVVAAPMFIVSTPELVIAQCTAGVVGSFPALNARPASQLDEWIHRIGEEGTHPCRKPMYQAAHQDAGIVAGSRAAPVTDIGICGILVFRSFVGDNDSLSPKFRDGIRAVILMGQQIRIQAVFNHRGAAYQM